MNEILKNIKTKQRPKDYLTENNISIYNSTDIPLDKISVDNTGLDIRSNENCIVNAKSWALVKTGLFISKIDDFIDFQIRSRSGLAAKNGVFVLNSPGTIDSSYRGEICVILANFSDNDFTVNKGDRIAQMTFSTRFFPVVEEIGQNSYINSINDSERSTGGFGSTGIK